MPKICPLYKAAFIGGCISKSLLVKDEHVKIVCRCDRNNCKLWNGGVDPEKYGWCGLKK